MVCSIADTAPFPGRTHMLAALSMFGDSAAWPVCGLDLKPYAAD
jgi:hypothetical protein